MNYILHPLFQGDGRLKITGKSVGYWGLDMRPVALRRGTARQLIEMFEKQGRSNHSGQGATLWVILLHCAFNGYAYDLRVWPGMGYMVTKFDPLNEGNL